MFLKSGFNDFVAKPIDIKQLDMVLNQRIRDTQSEEILREAETQARERAESRKQGDCGGLKKTGMDNEGRWLLEHPVEGIDITAALRLYGDSGAAFIPILKSFVTHTPPLIEKMDAHLETSLPDYAVEVHGFKGTCKAICAAETAELAKELEFASKDGNGELVRSRHGELRRQALELTGRLSALLDEWDAGRPLVEKKPRIAPDRELLARLSAATAEFNSNITEEVLGGWNSTATRKIKTLSTGFGNRRKISTTTPCTNGWKNFWTPSDNNPTIRFAGIRAVPDNSAHVLYIFHSMSIIPQGSEKCP
jgi:HPt (histidine-containing phosphotransfer) domain-containing protein